MDTDTSTRLITTACLKAGNLCNIYERASIDCDKVVAQLERGQITVAESEQRLLVIRCETVAAVARVTG